MELHVQKKYFDSILSGDKIYEGRLAKDKYRTLKIGDTILFKTTGTDSVIEKRIYSIHIYGSFKDAGDHLGVDKILPGISSVSQMANIYREFYSEKDEIKYNVIMIGIH